MAQGGGRGAGPDARGRCEGWGAGGAGGRERPGGGRERGVAAGRCAREMIWAERRERGRASGGGGRVAVGGGARPRMGSCEREAEGGAAGSARACPTLRAGRAAKTGQRKEARAPILAHETRSRPERMLPRGRCVPPRPSSSLQGPLPPRLRQAESARGPCGGARAAARARHAEANLLALSHALPPPLPRRQRSPCGSAAVRRPPSDATRAGDAAPAAHRGHSEPSARPARARHAC